MSRKMKFQLVVAIICIAVLVLVFALGIIFVHINCAKWNNGICPQCGKEYNAVQFLVKGDTWIRFDCENCGTDGEINAFYAYLKRD